MLEALAAFHELDTPGDVKLLPFRWSEDESWREEKRDAAAVDSGSGHPSADDRSPRADTLQYQSEADREAAERVHRRGPCGRCVGAE